MVLFEERFDGPLDPDRWVPAYLPAWSSRAEAAATYAIDDGLRLTLPPEHPRWCPDLHEEPLRVSAVQSGSWSGPVGSLQGQQPFREGLRVREEQPVLHGLVPRHGTVEVECRAVVGPGSMFSAWLIGMEDEPTRSGEICLMEVFGEGVTADGAAVGTGIKPFRDPALREEFAAEHQPIDVGEWHTYAIDWRPGGVTWHVDGRVVRTSTQSPLYPMLLICAVFDFPRRRIDDHVPELAVRRVAHRPA